MLDRERIYNILGWGAFVFACSVFFLPIINPDIFWHLSAGRYTLAHLGPPRTDFLSWPLAGQDWVDFEWLPQVFYYLLYKAGGFKALLFFKAGLLILTLLAFRSLMVLYGRRQLVWLVLPFFAAGIITNSDLRPENFTLLFFVLTLYALEKSRFVSIPEGGWFKAAFFAFFALWTNIHAGYLYGLALIGLYAAGEFFEEELPFVYGKAPFARPVKSLEYLKFFFLGLAASLVNPYGWKIYAVIANHQKYIDTLQEYIQEWTTFDLTNVYQWPYILSLLFVMGAFAFFVLRRKHIVYTHFTCLVYFLWASANHARHIPFFIIVGLAFTLSLPWGEFPVPKFKRALALSGGALWLLLNFWFYNNFIWTQYTGKDTLFKWGSEGLASFLKASRPELSGLKLFNPWGWGGWLGWELGPDYKVFVDGRYLFHDRISEMVEARNGLRNWQNLINKYKFDLMLITLDEPKVAVKQKLLNGKPVIFWRPAYLLYLPRSEWAVIYWDSSVAALVRRAAVPAAWLAEREYRYLRPADSLNIVAPLLAGELPLSAIKKEMQRYVRFHKAGEVNSVNGDVMNFVAGLEKICAAKGSKCAK